MKAKQLVFERTYDAPIERVWKALTDKEQLKAWYFDIAEFKPEPGFEFTFIGQDDCENFVHRCTVVEAIPPHRLSYTWAYEGHPGQSIVTIELKKLAERQTKLTLTHRGIDTFPADNDFFAPSNFEEGWTFILGESLRNFVETETFLRSQTIRASIETIWGLVLHPNGVWSNAFGGGAFVKDTDWQVGAPVVWLGPEGNIGANGVVTVNRENELLEVTFYDDTPATEDSILGDYVERYKLSPDADGNTVLTVEVGELAKTYIPQHAEMWEKALEIIREKAEGIIT